MTRIGVTTTRSAVPAAVPPSMREAWRALADLAAVDRDRDRDRAEATGVPATFDPDAVEHLPPPTRRWLRAAIEPGTPLTRAVAFRWHGRIRLGPWVPFRATQLLVAPHGFVWAGDAGWGPLRLRGGDRVVDGVAELDWRLGRGLRVVHATGPDVDRSAIGRLAGEALLHPPCALAPFVRWSPLDDRRAVAHVELGGRVHDLTVAVADDGTVGHVTFPRWGDADGRPAREHVFHVAYEGTVRHGGCAYPAAFVAGWDWDGQRWASGPFFRATLDGARAGL